MAKDKTDYIYHLSNASGSNIFRLKEDIYLGTDNNIYIGSCEEEVYGTGDACEGYWEEPVKSFDDIVEYIGRFDGIAQYANNTFTEVDREKFLELLKNEYEEICKEQSDIEL